MKIAQIFTKYARAGRAFFGHLPRSKPKGGTARRCAALVLFIFPAWRRRPRHNTGQSAAIPPRSGAPRPPTSGTAPRSPTRRPAGRPAAGTCRHNPAPPGGPPGSSDPSPPGSTPWPDPRAAGTAPAAAASPWYFTSHPAPAGGSWPRTPPPSWGGWSRTAARCR